MTMRGRAEARVRKWSAPRKAVHKAGHGGPRLTCRQRCGLSQLTREGGRNVHMGKMRGKDLSILMDWCLGKDAGGGEGWEAGSREKMSGRNG